MFCVLLVFFFQMTKSVTNPEELGGLASQMTSDYGHLALQGQMAAATAEPEEVCHLKPLFYKANPPGAHSQGTLRSLALPAPQKTPA